MRCHPEKVLWLVVVVAAALDEHSLSHFDKHVVLWVLLLQFYGKFSPKPKKTILLYHIYL